MNRANKPKAIKVGGVLLTAALVAVACTGGIDGDASTTPSSVAAPTTSRVAVEAAQPTVVVLPTIEVSFPAGALPSDATIKAAQVRSPPDVPDLAGVDVVGDGVYIDTGGVALASPATVTFDVPSLPEGAVAAAIHIADDGTWELLPAEYRDGQVVLTTSSFSVNYAAFLNPLPAVESFFGWAVNKLGLRSDPPSCNPGSQTWLQVTGGTSVVTHHCVSRNPQGDAEVVIKSNRSFWLEVTVPHGAKYVWVEGVYDFVRDTYRTLNSSPDTYLLPPGNTMTIGYDKPVGDRDVTVSISQNAVTRAVSVATIILDEFGLPGHLGELYFVHRCFGGISGAFGNSSFHDLLNALWSCFWDGADAFNEPAKVIGALEEFYGERLYTDQAVQAGAEKWASRLKTFGRFAAILKWGIGAVKMLDELASAFVELVAGQTVSIRLEDQAIYIPAPLETLPTIPAGPAPTEPAPDMGPTPGPSPTPATTATASSTPTPATPLSVSLSENPFVCDGQIRQFGTVTGAQPGERLGFSSPQEAGLLPGTANSNGSLTIQWQCTPAQASWTWDVTVRGTSSGRTGTFQVRGQAPAAPAPPPPPASTYAQTTALHTKTFTNHLNAGVPYGPEIPAYTTIQVSCRLEGFRVADGNTWWYRIASEPWSNQFYVTADVFYNNGATSGPLKGTPFVDETVPLC